MIWLAVLVIFMALVIAIFPDNDDDVPNFSEIDRFNHAVEEAARRNSSTKESD